MTLLSDTLALCRLSSSHITTVLQASLSSGALTAAARRRILVIRAFLLEQNWRLEAAVGPERQLKPCSSSSRLIDGWPYSPTVHSRQSLGIVQTVLNMWYRGTSIAQARAVIGSVTSLLGREVEGVASRAIGIGQPLGTKQKLPLINLLRALAIPFILYLTLAVQTSRELRA